MTESEFQEFHTFVLACFDVGRQRFTPELRRITTNKIGYSSEHEAYLRTTTSLAVTLENPGDYQKHFDIWVNPAYTRNSPRFRSTLAHELVHGYAGLKYGHNAHWRRWYYRVMYHLQTMGLLGVKDLAGILWGVEESYNMVSLVQGERLLLESIEKAKQEHTQVLNNYWRRIFSA